MSKGRLKKALKGLGVASLIASVGLLYSGCKEKEAHASCGKGSCGSKETSSPKDSGSCGKGSCGK